jgi:hypothetical protein
MIYIWYEATPPLYPSLVSDVCVQVPHVGLATMRNSEENLLPGPRKPAPPGPDRQT